MTEAHSNVLLFRLSVDVVALKHPLISLINQSVIMARSCLRMVFADARECAFKLGHASCGCQRSCLSLLESLCQLQYAFSDNIRALTRRDLFVDCFVFGWLSKAVERELKESNLVGRNNGSTTS